MSTCKPGSMFPCLIHMPSTIFVSMAAGHTLWQFKNQAQPTPRTPHSNPPRRWTFSNYAGTEAYRASDWCESCLVGGVDDRLAVSCWLFRPGLSRLSQSTALCRLPGYLQKRTVSCHVGSMAACRAVMYRDTTLAGYLRVQHCQKS